MAKACDRTGVPGQAVAIIAAAAINAILQTAVYNDKKMYETIQDMATGTELEQSMSALFMNEVHGIWPSNHGISW